MAVISSVSAFRLITSRTEPMMFRRKASYLWWNRVTQVWQEYLDESCFFNGHQDEVEALQGVMSSGTHAIEKVNIYLTS